jgi:3-oxoacyl-[acyl-carrier protein] reductase
MGSVLFPGSSPQSGTEVDLLGLSKIRHRVRHILDRSVTVNNVQPRPTATDMTLGYREMVMPLIPLGRMGEPAEIAGLVAYLASEEAGFITGASYTTDGCYVA